jgi:hypothetical protein
MKRTMDKAPTDGTDILVWVGDIWQWANFLHGDWYGAHHSSPTGNLLYLENDDYWMEMPPNPNEEK